MDYYTIKSTLETKWDYYICQSENQVLTITLLMMGWHELVTMSRIIPYSLIEFIPYFDQFKLQPNRSLTRQDWKKLILHSLLARAFTGIIYPVTVFLQLSTSSTFPDLPDIVSQIALFVVIEDFVYYWCHRALHWGPLYKHIHKMHHEYTFNRAIVAEYAHTVEALTVAFGFFMGPTIFTYYYEMHLVTLLLWFSLRSIQSIDCHSGYDFPWSLHHYLPIWAGAEFHEYHHQYFKGNYGSFFRIWDWVFGTSVSYEQKKLLMKEAKLKQV